jgi:hypothetical protein
MFALRRLYRPLCLGSLALVVLLTVPQPGRTAPQDKPPALKSPQAARRVHAPRPVLKGDDVIATVEGQPITRRQLTYFWLQVDKRVPAMIGDLVAEQWRAGKGSAHMYTLTDAAIYRRLYGSPDPALSNILSSLITNRLIAIVATRKGILVTEEQAWARAHELFEQFRKQRGIKDSDEQLMAQFQLPRDVFLEDMYYRVRSEKLLAADMAAHHEPAVAPDAWSDVVGKRMPAFLAELRKQAKITSTLPLPPLESAPPLPQNDQKPQEKQ